MDVWEVEEAQGKKQRRCVCEGGGEEMTPPGADLSAGSLTGVV